MKRFSVLLSAEAERHLERVADWYVQHHSAGIKQFLVDFERAAELLCAFPLAGRERAEYRSGIRSWNVHPYVLFYVVDETSRTATIYAILHGIMDVQDIGDR